MYQVKRNGRTVQIGGVKKFASFEEARQAVRKRIRKTEDKSIYNEYNGYWDDRSRSPTNYTVLGYRIKRMG